ncbi:hypothetical protein KCU65_g3330, partial [Aureobasidium melanogenum]
MTTSTSRSNKNNTKKKWMGLAMIPMQTPEILEDIILFHILLRKREKETQHNQVQRPLDEYQAPSTTTRRLPIAHQVPLKTNPPPPKQPPSQTPQIHQLQMLLHPSGLPLPLHSQNAYAQRLPRHQVPLPLQYCKDVLPLLNPQQKFLEFSCQSEELLRKFQQARVILRLLCAR